jgi:cobalamin synthase
MPVAGGALAVIAREIAAALTYLTGGEPGLSEEERVARGGAAFSALGGLLAIPVALVLWASGPLLAPPVQGVVGVALLWLTSRASLPLALGRVARAAYEARDDRERALAIADADASPGSTGAAAIALDALLKGAALSVLGGSTLGLAVVLAVVLGRWAMAVHAYGSLPARPDDLAATFVKQLQFNQFAVASVTAMAVTLAASNAMGVLLLFGVATVTIAFRITVHAWLGGITPATIRAAGELAETTALGLCALLVLIARALGD